MNPIYLSYFLDSSTPVYGGAENAFVLEGSNAISKGDTSNNSLFRFPAHIGTHIDFPKHFMDEGAVCSNYEASFWLFRKVGFLNCSIEEVPVQIAELPGDIELLILKTGFGSKRGEREYWAEQPVIPAGFAAMFRKAFPKLRVFGFDLISLTSKLDRPEGKKAHLQFLIDHNILILEDMDLRLLTNTPGTVLISPLLVANAEGVPCTVIAWDDDGVA
jgi:arylformamidase